MLQEPSTSSYDLHFNFLGFQVRVTWGFWIMAAVLGWSYCQGLDRAFSDSEIDSPGAGMLLVIWIAAILFSILIHELGHALAMRYYGIHSRIVLYHFGGLAIPESFGAWNAARRRSSLHPRDSIIVSAAGPGAQIALALAVWIVGRIVKMPIEMDDYVGDYFGALNPQRELPSSATVYAIFNMLVTPNIWWALLNLVPVLPLDGGNILQNGLRLFGNSDAFRTSYYVSLIASALLALYFFQIGQVGAGLMFLMLASSNWQMLQTPYRF